MRAFFYSILFVCLGFGTAKAQTFTFQCVDSTALTGANCDICPGNSTIKSRSLCGLLISKNGAPYKWIDQPYTMRVKTGNSVEYMEQIPNQDKITISLAQTPFSTLQGMIDSTWCHCKSGVSTDTMPLFYASDSTGFAPIFRGDTLTIVGRGVATVTFDSLLKKYVVFVDSVSGGSGIDTIFQTAPAQGFTISGSPGVAPTASFIFTLANDLAGLEGLTGTGFPARTATDTWALRTLQPGTGISITNPAGVAGDPTITNTAPDQVVVLTQGGTTTITGTYPNFTISSADQFVGTVTSFSAGNLSPIFTTSVATATTKPALSFTINTQTANTHLSGPTTGGAAAPTFRALVLEDILGLNTANNGLSDNEAGGGIFRLGNRYMNGSDGLFSFDRKINLNAFRLFIGDNTDSTLLHVDGTNDRVGVHTTAPGRTFTVNGEMEIKDLTTTNPTVLIAADANGVLSEAFLGTGLSFSGTTLNATGGSNYQTLRDDGVAATQQPNANFVSTARISTLLVNDAGNSETEVSFDVVANSIGNTHIRQGVARSVIGVTGNAGADVADIQGTADQVLRVNTAGTALAFGQVATAGIADDAVTYAKMQNISATTRWLGRITAGAGNTEELTLANMYTMLGLTGVANRFAIWTGANTLTSNAAYTFDGANGRMTVTPTAAGLGAGLAGLNISTGALGSMEFLQMRGSINGNLIAGQYNTNNASATAHSFYTVSSGGTAAGDAFFQMQIAGAGGVTSSFGIDNSDGDKIKLTPNSTTPGGTINHGLILTNDAVTLAGINTDAPAFPWDVAGKERSQQYIGINVAWGAGDLFFGLGAGTAPTFTGMTGTHNWVRVLFKTGTAPTANNVIFSVVRKATNEFAAKGFPVIAAGNANTAGEITKFFVGADNGITWNIVANGTLTASTDYELVVCFSGY